MVDVEQQVLLHSEPAAGRDGKTKARHVALVLTTFLLGIVAFIQDRDADGSSIISGLRMVTATAPTIAIRGGTTSSRSKPIQAHTRPPVATQKPTAHQNVASERHPARLPTARVMVDKYVPAPGMEPESRDSQHSIPRTPSFGFVFLAFLSGLGLAGILERSRIGLFAEGKPKEIMLPRMAMAAVEGTTPKELSDLSFEDAGLQVKTLDNMKTAGSIEKWGKATSRMEYYKVDNRRLKQIGLDAVSLGIIEGDEAFETVKNATAAVFVGFSILAVAAGAIVGGNNGATLTYLLGAVPVVFLAVGSVAPGVIIGLISVVTKGAAESEIDEATGVSRRVLHEAAHFLAGYLLGVPVAGYTVEKGVSCVEFHPTVYGPLVQGQQLSKEDIDKLSVIALSGTVAEAKAFGRATGGGQDLTQLASLLRICVEPLNSTQQQEQTRWAAYQAWDILRLYKKEYQALCKAFAENKPIPDCISLLEKAI